MLGLHKNVLLPGGKVALPGSTRPGVSKPQIQNRENVVTIPAHSQRAAWAQGNSVDCESESQVLASVCQLPAREPRGCWP